MSDSRLRLAWLALRGRLYGGIYVSPINGHARFTMEACRIEQRVGDVPMITLAPDWPKEEA